MHITGFAECSLGRTGQSGGTDTSRPLLTAGELWRRELRADRSVWMNKQPESHRILL